jgi:hypothetical protein
LSERAGRGSAPRISLRSIRAAELYEVPFTNKNPMGLNGVFNQPDAATVVSILDDVRRRAVA